MKYTGQGRQAGGRKGLVSIFYASAGRWSGPARRAGWLALPLAATALLLAACGGSSGGSSPPPPPPPPPPASNDIVSVGAVSAIGSVTVNGIRFDTGSANVTMDDQPGNFAEVQVGMVVSVRGMITPSTGAARANGVSYVSDANGIITGIDRVAGTFEVLGRQIQVDEMTMFVNATFDTLAEGNVVRVNGMWRNQERIQATYVERIANAHTPGMMMEVKGMIAGLDPGTQHFFIGTQSCDYSSATLDLEGATLENGLYVSVYGSEPMMTNGDLLLDRIQARDRDRDRDRLCSSDCDFELEGFITRFESPEDFDVDNLPVTTTGATIYVNGTVDTLGLDVKVAVDGTLDATGILIADRIVFRFPSVIEIEADIEDIDAAAGTLVLLGVTIATNESTWFHDDSTSDVWEFGLADLAVGDRVEVRAYLDGDVVTASRLEREDADDSVTLKAPVEAIARPSLTLLGITVTAAEGTVFQNELQEVIDADTFFSTVAIGSIVRAEGSYDGTSITAEQLFLRDCDNGCL